MTNLGEAIESARSRIESASSPAGVYRATAECAVRLLDCDACELFVVGDGAVDDWTRIPADPSADSPGSRSVAKRTHRSEESIRIDDASRDGQVDAAYRSLLSVPLGGHAVLQFADREPNAFDEEALALAVVFGGYVAARLDEATGSEPLPPGSAAAALERAAMLIVALDCDGQVTFVNRQTREILGYDEGELAGCDWFGTCLPEGYHNEVRETFERVVEGDRDTVDCHENPVVTAEGGERIVRWRNAALYDAAGNLTGTVSCGLDVTDRAEHDRELGTIWKRYRTLLQASPDPVFVADADTGEIIEVNEAAEAFRGQPSEEIVGLYQTDLHPADEAERYRDLFERHVADGGTKRHLPDGSPIYATTADGDRVPVAISVETIELDRETVVYGVFRDVSEQLAYERALTGINEVTRDLFDATPSTEIGQQVVEAVVDVLGAFGAVLYLLDEDEGVLRPVAYAPETVVDVDAGGAPPTFEPGESVAWQVFVDGETAAVDDGRTAEDVYNAETPIRSEIVVPVGAHGVLMVGETAVGAFDERAVDLVEILGAAAEAALDRAEHERTLENRTQQLEQRTRQLERAESINAHIRDVVRIVSQSTTRREVQRAACAELAGTDVFAFAWIGEVDPVDDRLAVQAWAGNGREYLDRVDLSVDGDSTEPAVRTAESGAVTVVSNTAANMAREPWRSEAVRRNFQSAMSVPLVYRGTLQGTLTVYATTQSAFSDVLQPVLTELGDLLAHAVAAIERKLALLTNYATELDFEIRDRDCLFLWFTRETNCTLELESIIPQSDDSSLVFVRVRNGSTERFLEATETTAAIESARLVDDDASLVQLRFVEPYIASMLADQGISVRHISADDAACRVTVAVPSTFGIRQAVDVVSTVYPDAELVAKRERTPSPDAAEKLPGQVLDRLTPRQREVLEVAYVRGYFDSPKRVSGTELASEFDFSSSAFHQHIRAAERKLFEALFEGVASAHTDDSPG